MLQSVRQIILNVEELLLLKAIAGCLIGVAWCCSGDCPLCGSRANVMPSVQEKMIGTEAQIFMQILDWLPGL